MGEHNTISPDNYKPLQILRNWLHSEMKISEPEQMVFGRGTRIREREGIEIAIEVQNKAPVSSSGGDVVFLGVGLRILYGKENTRMTWLDTFKKSRTTDQPELRQRYSKGVWCPQGSVAFPAVTRDEESFGDVLFPGENVIYEFSIPPEYLPYLDIQVEGSVSRRHLLHVVQNVDGLKPWKQPLLVETSRALDSVDIHQPLLMVTDAMPEMGPQTTLADIEKLKTAVSEAIDQVGSTLKAINEVFHSAPNQEIRDHLKQNEGRYLSSLTSIYTSTLDARASGEPERMREVTEELKAQLPVVDDIKRKQIELMSRFGVSADDVKNT